MYFAIRAPYWLPLRACSLRSRSPALKWAKSPFWAGGTQDKDDVDLLFVEGHVGGCRVFGHHGDGRGFVLDRKFITGLTFHVLWQWVADWKGRGREGRGGGRIAMGRA